MEREYIPRRVSRVAKGEFIVFVGRPDLVVSGFTHINTTSGKNLQRDFLTISTYLVSSTFCPYHPPPHTKKNSSQYTLRWQLPKYSKRQQWSFPPPPPTLTPPFQIPILLLPTPTPRPRRSSRSISPNSPPSSRSPYFLAKPNTPG